MTETKTLPRATPSKTPPKLPKHIVAFNKKGEPEDKALCGFLWDRLFVRPDGPVCGDCAEELMRRGGSKT